MWTFSEAAGACSADGHYVDCKSKAAGSKKLSDPPLQKERPRRQSGIGIPKNGNRARGGCEEHARASPGGKRREQAALHRSARLREGMVER